MDQKTPNPPAHEVAYRRLREMVLDGELEPGQAVTIQGLVALLQSGMTPVREAIRRLIAEGGLEFQGNRRVSVPVLDRPRIEELAFARLALEPWLAGQAAVRIRPAEIATLERIDDALNAAIARGDVRAYLRRNYEFHARLYAASGATVLTGLVDALWLRMGPSLRVVCGRFGTSNLPDMHESALAALRAGDAAATEAAIHADISQGFAQIRLSLAAG
ncbi:GntR family transcriptional regulator [Limimaricola sp.]|uniref:GntR family transcriptional regulator n=1 Tax=Limimaricola sp. TaxID=2211665 RepID=UPI0025C2C912|nr:GntR family transcriptional regulator [Limimaricola sp.]